MNTQPVYKRVASRSQDARTASARGVRRVHVADADAAPARRATPRHSSNARAPPSKPATSPLPPISIRSSRRRRAAPRASTALLQAARLAADYGDTALARRRVGEARSGATVAQQQTSTVLLARLELAEGRPQAALDMLAALPQALPRTGAARRRRRARPGAVPRRPARRCRAHARRARSLARGRGFDRRQPAHDLGRLSRIAGAAADGADRRCSRRRLARAGAARPRARGRSCAARCSRWRQTYPSHPAAAGLLAELLAAQRSTAFPSQIALLLPLSSPQRAVALAIRDGFMAAHLRNSSNSATSVRVYDSARLGSSEAYLQAQLDGADFIVGPLLGPEVDQVIAQAGFVPTLALNLRDERHDVPQQLLSIRVGARGRGARDRGGRDRGRREDRHRVRAEQSTRLSDPGQLPAAFEAGRRRARSIGTAMSRRCRISRNRRRRC